MNVALVSHQHLKTATPTVGQYGYKVAHCAFFIKSFMIHVAYKIKFQIYQGDYARFYSQKCKYFECDHLDTLKIIPFLQVTSCIHSAVPGNYEGLNSGNESILNAVLEKS